MSLSALYLIIDWNRDVIEECSTLCEIDPEVSIAFPEIKIGVAQIEGVTVRERDDELEGLKRQVEEVVRARHVPLAERPRVAEMKAIYKRFGSDPRSKKPSAEALLKRVSDASKGLYTINTVVDAYNLSSIESELPMAAYDLDTLKLPVLLRFAREQEHFTGLGQSAAEPVPAGELVYADGVSVCCRSYNYRDSDRTKVTLSTRNLLVFVDAGATTSREELSDILDKLVERIVQFNGGTLLSRSVIGRNT